MATLASPGVLGRVKSVSAAAASLESMREPWEILGGGNISTTQTTAETAGTMSTVGGFAQVVTVTSLSAWQTVLSVSGSGILLNCAMKYSDFSVSGTAYLRVTLDSVIIFNGSLSGMNLHKLAVAVGRALSVTNVQVLPTPLPFRSSLLIESYKAYSSSGVFVGFSHLLAAPYA